MSGDAGTTPSDAAIAPDTAETTGPSSGFNLSAWALKHKSFVVFLMLISALSGAYAYGRLGREEDPPFTVKTMIVKTLWPGATATDTVQQITDRIEKKLEEIPNLDFVRSYTKPGESVVFVNLKDSVRAAEVPEMWYQVRKKVNDIRATLPSGIAGPFFNDEFGDTYALIYAFTADGFSRRELRESRPRRHAGREDLSRILDAPACRPRPGRQRARPDSANAERDYAQRRGRRRTRTDRHPRLGRVHVRSEPERHQLQAEQPARPIE
jgi:hypothetical protein